MDALFPWERLIWQGRSFPAGRSRYFLTTFRLAVDAAGGHADEILLEDIRDARCETSKVGRILGLSTIVVSAHDPARRPFVLHRMRRGAQLAALIELAAGDPGASPDAGRAAAFLEWEPRVERYGFRAAFLMLVVALASVFVVGAGLRGRAASISYPSDDAIYPNGEKRSREEIVRFMESSVMPWAKDTFAPLTGGRDRVTCATCHGRAPEARGWSMPAVTALLQPDIARHGWDAFSEKMNAETRNAVYGYVAEADNQRKAAYMREVVMPGMARLLRRPAYDFTSTYDYNRTRFAFGCYHCHQVK